MAEESTAPAQEQVTYEHPIGKWGDKPILEEQREAGWPAWPKWEPTWFDVGGVKFAAFGDRLLIVEDKFRSGYECRGCDGRGTVSCDQCNGEGHYEREGRDFKCSQCLGGGKLRCNECDGKGALLVIPEVSQRRPSTGRIVSIGDDPKCRYFHVGDNVLYSNFAGHALELDESGKAIRPGDEAKVVLRILHAGEILSMVKGHLELRSVSHEREALGI